MSWRALLLLAALLAGCATSEPLEAVSDDDERWLSSPFDTRVWGYAPRTGAPAASNWRRAQ